MTKAIKMAKVSAKGRIQPLLGPSNLKNHISPRPHNHRKTSVHANSHRAVSSILQTNPQKERETLRNVFQFSVKYAALLIVPAAAAIMALSKPLVFTLFGTKYAYAPLFLALCAASYLYSALGSLSLGNLINAKEKPQST